MPHHNIDRRVKRTRDLLQKSLYELIDEMGFEKITVQDITDRANLGRTTFYSHYKSKEDLFVKTHLKLIHQVGRDLFDEDHILSPEPSLNLINFLEILREERGQYLMIKLSKGSGEIFAGIRTELAGTLNHVLHHILDESDSTIPFTILAEYLAGAMLSLVGWWLDSKAEQSAEEIARIIHQLQVAAIRDAIRTD